MNKENENEETKPLPPRTMVFSLYITDTPIEDEDYLSVRDIKRKLLNCNLDDGLTINNVQLLRTFHSTDSISTNNSPKEKEE